jgi:hypothetical protein
VESKQMGAKEVLGKKTDGGSFLTQFIALSSVVIFRYVQHMEFK